MLSFRNLIIVSLSLIIAFEAEWTTASKERSPEEYIPYLSYPSNMKIRAVEWIEAALAKQKAKSLEETRSNLAKLAEDKLQSVEGFDGKQLKALSNTLADLAEVANLEGNAFCSSYGVDGFLSNVLAIRGATGQKVSLFNPKSTQGKSELFDYIMAFGPKHSQKCLGQLSKSFDEIVLNNRGVMECESKLDQIVTLGKAAGQPEERLLELAKEIDFMTGSYDGKRMQQVVEKVFNVKATDVQETLFRFLDDTCYQFREQVSDIFDSFNLARIILPSAMRYTQFSSKFYKFNEYSRLCAQIQAPHLRDLIKAQFSKTKKWY